VVVAVGVTDVGVSDVTAPTPLSTVAKPKSKTAVRAAASPAVMVSAAATKLTMSGCGGVSEPPQAERQIDIKIVAIRRIRLP
jgi:hypothetical protein|tara:strand:- start:153 stop:398 length:246 start_codon:yes stop_codon:yes gene_type:complete